MKFSEKQIARTFVDLLEDAHEETIKHAAEMLIQELAVRFQTHKVKDIVSAIEKVWKEKFGASIIEVETAYPLSSSSRKKIESFAHGADIKEKVIPTLIGGARLRIDETIIEGSIAGYLKELSHAFSNA